MQITDTQRLNWLIENVTYLEHGGPKLKDGYWPKDGEDEQSLLDYIDEQLTP